MSLTAIAICALIAQSSHTQKTDYNVFQANYIGAPAREAFLHPDSVTVQRVFPLRKRGSMPMPKHPRMQRLGRETIVPVGTAHPLSKADAQRLVTSLNKPEYSGGKECDFHPDHLIRFKKGNTIVEALTCFTCEEIISFVDGVQKARTSFSIKGPFFPEIWKFCSHEDDARAYFGELGEEKIVDALLKGANSGTVQYGAGVPPEKFYHARQWKDAKLSRAKVLPKATTIKIINYLLENSGARPNAGLRSIDFRRTDGWKVVLNTRPPITFGCGTGFINTIRLGLKTEITWTMGYRLGHDFDKDFRALK